MLSIFYVFFSWLKIFYGIFCLSLAKTTKLNRLNLSSQTPNLKSSYSSWITMVIAYDNFFCSS